MDGNVELPGSYRTSPEGAEAVGDVDPADNIAVTVHLRPGSADARKHTALIKSLVPTTRTALAAERLAEYAVVGEAFQRFAVGRGLTARLDLVRRCVHLKGTVARISRSFEASLRIYGNGHERFRARSGSLQIPKEIAPWTLAVLGFDHRPVVARSLTSLANETDSAGLWPMEVADLYGFSPEADAAGQCVGIIALGGGYLPSDLALVAETTKRPLPVVVDYSVGGINNNFGGGNPADQEVALDLQILASLVPSARIVVYFAANNTQSLAEAIHQAVSDDVNRPQILSISWGSAEKFWTDSAREAIQVALQDAVRLRVSVVVAAGDLLATSGLADGAGHVLFPASSPHALSCGGTRFVLEPDGATLEDETVWNDGFAGTGGGISDTFQIPDYQLSIKLPQSINDGGRRRGLPDVAAAAAQNPGYRIVVNGQTLTQNGTSAAAPLWASLIAMANRQRGEPVGFINPFLYRTPGVCRAISTGNNRSNGVGYDAVPGWNACAGLGVPNGAETVAALAAMP
jgi:kumamolisin